MEDNPSVEISSQLRGIDPEDAVIEVKGFHAPMELRARKDEEGEDTEERLIVGHAAVFDVWSPVYWGFKEKIVKGAFKESIGEDDVRALWNHNSDWVLGRNVAKPSPTLRMWEDDIGLVTEIDPPATNWANDHLVTIGRGDVNQMSFAFIVLEEKWTYMEDEETDKKIAKREILKVSLRDVSPVTYPWYPTTDVGTRSETLGELARNGLGVPIRTHAQIFERGITALREELGPKLPVELLEMDLDLIGHEFPGCDPAT